MKKTLDSLIDQLHTKGEHVLTGGFRSIRGGKLPSANGNCTNDTTCGGTNSKSCTNSSGATCNGTNSTSCSNKGDCTKATNSYSGCNPA